MRLLSMDAGILFDPEEESLYRADGGAISLLSGQFQIYVERERPDGCDTNAGRDENSRTSRRENGMRSQAYVWRATATRSSSQVPPISSLQTEISQPLLTFNMLSSLVPASLLWNQIIFSVAPLTTQESGSLPVSTLMPSVSLSAGFSMPSSSRSNSMMLPSSHSSLLSMSSKTPLSLSSSNAFYRSSASVESSSALRAPFFTHSSSSVPAYTSSIGRPSHQTTVPVVSGNAASLSVHPTSWYLGVAFGSIAGVALLVFLIAAALCMWKSARRRRRAQDTIVPWALKPGDEEEGRLMRSNSSRNAATNREDLATVPTWTADRDRYVREPRWASGGTSYSLRDHPIPGHGLFSDANLAPPTFRSTSTPFHPKNALRQLPSHLIDEELSARVMQDGSNLAGRPVRLRKFSQKRRSESNPYIDSDDKLRLGLADQQPTKMIQQSMAERLRNLGKEPSWDRLPTPGRDQPREDIEPWAASFKSSIVSAFNAFAANITSSSVFTNPRPDDGFTTAPTRRREPLRNNSHKPLTRKGSSNSSIHTKGWVLHEKGDGSGTVQILPTLDKYEGEKITSKRPGKLEPMLSFGNDESFATYDEKGNHFQQKTARRSLIPLVVSRTPAKAIIRPESPFKKLDSGDYFSGHVSISRNSSVYSVVSSVKHGATRRKPGVVRLPRVPSIAKYKLNTEEDDFDTIVIEPDIPSRRLSFESTHPLGYRLS